MPFRESSLLVYRISLAWLFVGKSQRICASVYVWYIRVLHAVHKTAKIAQIGYAKSTLNG